MRNLIRKPHFLQTKGVACLQSVEACCVFFEDPGPVEACNYGNEVTGLSASAALCLASKPGLSSLPFAVWILHASSHVMQFSQSEKGTESRRKIRKNLAPKTWVTYPAFA